MSSATPPTVSTAKTGYVYVVAGLTALGGLLFGYDTGVISGALLFIRKEFGLSPFLQGFVVSSLLIGAMVGALGCGPLTDRFGRRNIVILAAVVFGLGALIAGSAPGALVLVLGRIVLGLGVGLASVIVPLYIAEMSPPDIRGLLVALNQLMITVGILLSYVVGYAFAGSGNWRVMLLLAVVPAIVLLAGMLFMPESPRWLVANRSSERARAVLRRIRGTDQVEIELGEIEEAERREQAGWRELLQPWLRPVLVVGVLLNFLGQASGINTVIYFAPTIFETTGFQASASILATAGIGVVNVVMTVVGMSIVDKAGRKTLLLVGLVGMILSLGVLGLAFLLQGLSGVIGYVALACLVVYIASFAVSIGVVIFIIPSEIFPLKVRGSAMSICLLTNWGSNFAIATVFLTLLDVLGRSATFWLFAVMCVAFWLFTYFFIPETKGRSLEEIEVDLRSRTTITSPDARDAIRPPRRGTRPEPLGRAAVIVEEGRILEVIRDPRRGGLPSDLREAGGFICPGFIDLQINGSFGADVGPEPEALKTLARELPKTGTTSFLPTAISWPAGRYLDFLRALGDASRSPGANMLGAHLEGPFLSPARKGAHNPANLRPVDLDLTGRLVGSGLVCMMTLAPELPGGQEAIRRLSEAGVVASAGHTDATYEEMVEAIDAGLPMGTHLYNAMSPLTHRAPGAVGAVLADDRVRAGVIADGVHVHGGALRVAHRQKGPEGLALVTDAMEAAGMPPGVYELSGTKVRLKNGAVRLADGTLAGSALTMDAAVRKAVEMLGIPLYDAVRMATETPAEVLGAPKKGRIVSGADADLVVLGRDGTIQETIVAGETVHAKQEDET